MSEDKNTNAANEAAMNRVRTVKNAHENALLKKANVVGVGIGLQQRGGERTGEIALVVMVRQKVPRDQLAEADVIPNEIDGVPVDVQEVGEIKAQG